MIEDNLGDARLIREMLDEVFGDSAVLVHERMFADGANRLENEQFDVLFVDLALPDSQGLETLDKVRPFAGAVSVVVLTRSEDEERAEKAVSGGTQDYLVKGKITPAIRARSIRYSLGRNAAEEALRGSEAALARQAEELKDLVTVAAHELRHPATVFKGYSYILLENADCLDSEVARDALLNRVESEFKAQGVRISTRDETEEGAVLMADREKLRAVLANLVGNAVKFSPAGPAVDVSAETALGEWIRHRPRAGGGSIFEFFIPGSVAT